MSTLTFRNDSFIWAWLFILTGADDSEIDAFAKQYALDTKTKNNIPILKHVVFTDIEDWTYMDMYTYGIEIGLQANDIFVSLGMYDYSWKLNHLNDTLAIKSKKDLAIDGNEIITLLGIKPGKEIGELLTKVEYAVVMNQIPNTADSLKDYISYAYETGY